MKILVTGGAGFIASHVVDLYLAQGHEVVIVDNLSTGRRANLNPAAKFYEVDIRSPQVAEILAAERPEVVNHHAAQIDVRRSVADPRYDAEINVLGSLNLIAAAQQQGVKRFIYISSGGAMYGEPRYLPCDENHPVEALSPYGASKHTPEHYLFLYRANYGLEYTVLRYANVYGPRQDPLGEAGVVAIFTGRMLEGQPVTINGDGEQTRDFVYVGDCAHANLLALSMTGSDMYNVGTGYGSSVNDIFRGLKPATGYTLAPNYGPAKLGETRHIYLDIRKIKEHLGWEPSVNLNEGLRLTLAALKVQ